MPLHRLKYHEFYNVYEGLARALAKKIRNYKKVSALCFLRIQYSEFGSRVLRSVPSMIQCLRFTLRAARLRRMMMDQGGIIPVTSQMEVVERSNSTCFIHIVPLTHCGVIDSELQVPSTSRRPKMTMKQQCLNPPSGVGQQAHIQKWIQGTRRRMCEPRFLQRTLVHLLHLLHPLSHLALALDLALRPNSATHRSTFKLSPSRRSFTSSINVESFRSYSGLY